MSGGRLTARWLLYYQLALLIGAWLFVIWLHYPNDGLWSPDASRHAANGLFWKDFLQSPTLQIKDYALSYFARYPVIKPSV